MRTEVQRTVQRTVCDVCGFEQTHPALMNICVCCGREYCMHCGHISTNPFDVPVCGECHNEPQVEELLVPSLPRYRKEKDALVELLKALNIKKDRKDREVE